MIVTNSNGTSTSETIGPKTFNRGRTARTLACGAQTANKPNLRALHAVMGKEQPEAENGLSHNVEDGIGDDLNIDTGNTGAVGNSPNAARCQWYSRTEARLTDIGYIVQRIKVKPAMAPKKALDLLSLLEAAWRPLKAS